MEPQKNVHQNLLKIEPAVASPHSGKVTDAERFIRQAFDTNPQLGCEQLFRHYYQALCSHAVHFVYSKEIAEDIVSEIFYRFYEKQLYTTVTTSYCAYLYRAVRNSSLNYLKWEATGHTPLDQSQIFKEPVNGQPDEILQYQELYREIEKAIAGMPGQRRKIYLMHRFEGKKYAEIAGELSLSPRTVEVQIRKASHHLRDLLRHKKLVSFLFLILLNLQ